jgi:PPOX class probable F420-dependent enzyme
MYGERMLSNTSGLSMALDSALIGFLTAVNIQGQPQTSPIWFIRDGEDIVVYNRPTAARLESIDSNDSVAFNLRADRRARSGISLEGAATVDASLPPAIDFPGYVDKYGEEIKRLGWTPESFTGDYSVGLRITVTRVRDWGVSKLNAGEYD